MFRSGNQIGAYILIEKLGKGGFGEVWLAEKRSQFVTKKVAVKLPHDEQVKFEAIRQEATLWEQASGHPNVLPIIDADIYDEQVIIVSEYAEGGSLADKLKTDGKLSTDQALEMTIGILKGLDFLHSKEIIHRDIKPQNVLLQGNTPRLADFGISRAMSTSTISSVVVGTDAYMAPEAFDGKRNVQTDIWSVGVVLYQLLTDELPFPQEHPSERMFAVLTKEFEPLPDKIPEDLRKIVQRALSKKPELRFQTAGEMGQSLDRVLTLLRNPTFAQTEILDSKRIEEAKSKAEIESRQTNSPEQNIETKSYESDELPKTYLPEQIKTTKYHESDEIPKTPQAERSTKPISDEPDELPKTTPPHLQESVVTQPKGLHKNDSILTKTSSKIPPTEVQTNSVPTNEKPKTNKSLYLYLAGIFAVLFFVAVIGIGGLYLYISNGFGSKNPVDIANKPNDSEIDQSEGKFAVIKVSENKLLLNGAEINKSEVVEEIKSKMADKSPDQKIIYVSADDDTIYKKIVEVLELGRKANIGDFGLMLSNEKVSDSVKIELPSTNPTQNNLNFPSSNAFQEVAEKPKLNPLRLIITIDNNGEIKLNDTFHSSKSLGSNLRNIFKDREINGVFKYGTNEIEKTVFVKATHSTKYGNVLKVIRTAEKAGASPIVIQTDDSK